MQSNIYKNEQHCKHFILTTPLVNRNDFCGQTLYLYGTIT